MRENPIIRLRDMAWSGRQRGRGRERSHSIVCALARLIPLITLSSEKRSRESVVCHLTNANWMSPTWRRITPRISRSICPYVLGRCHRYTIMLYLSTSVSVSLFLFNSIAIHSCATAKFPAEHVAPVDLVTI